MLIASWLTGRHAYPDKIILLVAASSSLVMILFCSFEDRPAHYRMSFNHGVFGLLMGMSLAFFIVQAKRCLSKVIILIMIKTAIGYLHIDEMSTCNKIQSFGLDRFNLIVN